MSRTSGYIDTWITWSETEASRAVRPAPAPDRPPAWSTSGRCRCPASPRTTWPRCAACGAEPGGGDRVPGRGGHPAGAEGGPAAARPDADPDEVEAALEERDLLFARILQYRAYKQVAGLFGARLAEQAHLPRRVGAEDLLRRIVPELLVGVAPKLARLAAAALTRRTPAPEVTTTHIAPQRLSVAEAVTSLAQRLRTRGPVGSRTWSATRPPPSRSSSACSPSWSCTSDRWSSSTRRRPSATSPSAGPAATWSTPPTSRSRSPHDRPDPGLLHPPARPGAPCR